MTAIIALAGLAAATWLLRVTFVTLLSPADLPPAVRAGLDYIGPAVTAGLIVMLVAGGEGGTGLWVSPAQATALGVAIVAVVRGATLLQTMAAAMAALWVVDLLILG
jgi:branched-subunit amino acid transport protein